MRRFIIGGVALVIVVLAGIVGYRYYDSSQRFVATDNALVSGDLVQVATTNAGRVSNVSVDVGDVVKKDQTVGTVEVSMPSSLGLAASAGGPVQGTRITADLTSPVNGVVVAKPASVGDLVAAGQPVLQVVDLGNLWVTANVDEANINKVNVGQPVEVHIDTLDKTLQGTVMAITPASAATFSLLPQNNAAGNYTKVTQRVPVKITVDYAGNILFPGTSAEVTIQVK